MGEDTKKTIDGITIVPTPESNFMRVWLEVLRPLHRLTQREMDYAAVLLNKRNEISKKVRDPRMVDVLLFNKDTKEEVAKEAGVSKEYAKTVLKKLRTVGIVEGKKVSEKYIVKWTPGESFRWLFRFDIKK